jgi:hypothetical protein
LNYQPKLKQQRKDWLLKNGTLFRPQMLTPEIYRLVRVNKAKLKEKHRIDSTPSEHGHIALRLQKGHETK